MGAQNNFCIQKGPAESLISVPTIPSFSLIFLFSPEENRFRTRKEIKFWIERLIISSAEDFDSIGTQFQFQRKISLFDFLLRSSSLGSEKEKKCPWCERELASAPFRSGVATVVMYSCENWTIKKGWALKNWCFRIVVLKKTLESPLVYKDIKSVNPKGNQPWIFIGRIDAEAEALTL